VHVGPPLRNSAVSKTSLRYVQGGGKGKGGEECRLREVENTNYERAQGIYALHRGGKLQKNYTNLSGGSCTEKGKICGWGVSQGEGGGWGVGGGGGGGGGGRWVGGGGGGGGGTRGRGGGKGWAGNQEMVVRSADISQNPVHMELRGELMKVGKNRLGLRAGE